MNIEKAISDLLTFYRATFPDETITPKLHLLEDHVCPFIEKWGGSFGLYGEQGMEGLHANLNGLKTSFSSMPNPQERLKSIMKEHYSRTSLISESTKKKIEIKSRKRKITL